jgi:hypothetical protein
MNRDYLYKNTNSNKFKISELLVKYDKTFKKPLGLVIVFIDGNSELEEKLINLLESSISNKKEFTKKDIEKFYPVDKGVVV